MPSPASDPEYNLTLRQADQARGDFGTVLDELDLVKWQLSQLPTRAYFCRMLLVATASVWAILAALALWLAR
jgi:hypothetical protein